MGKQSRFYRCNSVLDDSGRRASFYYEEVCDAMHIDMDWIAKLPFHTVRWAYFQITRTFIRLPEANYQDAMKNLEEWFKTKVFDERGNLRPRKKGGE